MMTKMIEYAEIAEISYVRRLSLAFFSTKQYCSLAQRRTIST